MNIMKNKTSKILAVVGAGVLALATQSTFADPLINGGITFGTTSLNPFTTDSSNPLSLATATSMVINNTGIFVSSASGDYATTSLFGLIPPGPINFNGFSWAGYGAIPTADIIALWNFTDSLNYSFTATTLSAVYSAGSDQWTFGGTGVANATGYAATLGNWTMQIGEVVTFPGPQIAFSWDSTATAAGSAALPDGGMTVALLGGAFIGLGMLRRKLCN
jgi:hypothetical protein